MEEEKQGAQEIQLRQIADKCKEVETPLTTEELDRDYSLMTRLELGENKNYKTKIVQNRWQ